MLGIDIDRAKVESYALGSMPIYEPGLADLLNTGMQKGNLRLQHTSGVEEPLGDVVLICTGTPTSPAGSADLSQVRSAVEWVAERQHRSSVVVVKSTVPPGTGVRISDSLLNGTDLEYVSNPEFLREGEALSDWSNPDRIVIGGRTEKAVQAAKSLYHGIEAPYVVTDITSAEMIKYTANAFLATKISFINEIASLCDRLGASIDDIHDGVALDPRIGGRFLRAGVGYGGSCFPKDVRALDYLALASGHNFELLRSVITVNNRQRLLPYHAMRQRFGSVADVTVGVLGLAFKPHTDDMREAPALDLIHVLVDQGAEVRAYDPMALGHAEEALPDSVRLVDDMAECVDGAQALVLMTEWPQIVDADWQDVARKSAPPRFLFDGRNALVSRSMRQLGFEYVGVGRNGPKPWDEVED